MIAEAFVITGRTPVNLNIEIEKHVALGYQPQGGVMTDGTNLYLLMVGHGKAAAGSGTQKAEG